MPPAGVHVAGVVKLAKNCTCISKYYGVVVYSVMKKQLLGKPWGTLGVPFQRRRRRRRRRRRKKKKKKKKKRRRRNKKEGELPTWGLASLLISVYIYIYLFFFAPLAGPSVGFSLYS